MVKFFIKIHSVQFSSSVVSDSLRPHGLQHARLPSITNSQNLLKLVQWVGDAIQPSHPLLSPYPLAVNLSQQQGLFQWVSSLCQVTKVLELQHQSFQWMFRVDFLWIDWLYLLAVKGILNSLIQHHNSKVSILCHAAFIMVQLSHLYITTGKTIALTIWTFWQSDVCALA